MEAFRAFLLYIGCLVSAAEELREPQLLQDVNHSLSFFGGNCKQHGSCRLCVHAGCGWCPTTGRCEGPSAQCHGKAVEQSCPPEPEGPNITDFSLDMSLRMMKYAYASYYEKPEKHGLPSYVEVVKTFSFSLGLWDRAFAFVALDETDRQIVLAFRGSETVTQLVVEILYHTLVPWQGDEKIRVNEFFMWAADDLLPQINPVLQQLEERCRDCQLLVTGHSLGASMAMLAAYNISFWSSTTPIIYTFGQPRTSNGAFAQMVEKRLPLIFRLVNAADPVPHIPLCSRSDSECADDKVQGYYHTGMEMWFPSGDYEHHVMCHYRECVGEPHSEDLSCSNGLGFPEAAVVFDHHRYWDVIKAGGFCGGQKLLVV